MFHNPNYKFSEGRALSVIALSQYGSVAGMAADLKCSRQYISSGIDNGIALKYINYLARKFEFRPAVLSYTTYLFMGGEDSYEDIVKGCKLFSAQDVKYILKGEYIKEPAKFIKSVLL